MTPHGRIVRIAGIENAKAAASAFGRLVGGGERLEWRRKAAVL